MTATDPHRNRRDVTERVDLTRPEAVARAVCDIYLDTYGGSSHIGLLQKAFRDFAALFEGRYHGYHACDTLYHDTQHTLDVTLAMARLMNGHERSHPLHRLGSQRFVLGIVIALFHDAGYIRHEADGPVPNGAVFTLTHVSRSGEFLRRYLPRLGLARYARLAAVLVHYTGYEVDLDDLHPHDPRDRKLGHLLGTADLIAQMSDRCYLEKCRDRLYPEFVLCGLAGEGRPGHPPMFRSPADLLRKTPDFYRHSVEKRLDGHFNRAYRYVEAFFGEENHYMARIRNTIDFLERISEQDPGQRLRRQPPIILPVQAEPLRLLRPA